MPRVSVPWSSPFWLGQPRTSPASFCDYFDALLGWEPFRAAQYGSPITARSR